ncbi:HupE/UreJ family protein [Pararhodobacter sp. SW119]|uniref:HupE/UreJ family protein n=1 Tax=Pararhodobacter sp. SW119 TaxID=2780075 RepID=UPI001ADFDC65|nr:HupE/UreJ family protein [Pararhodobacter sp. SW119]
MRARRSALPLLLLPVLLLPATAAAHPHHDHAGGFLDGVAHPLLGLDHLLAMVAVGLWAALTGGRALWALPLAFLAAMAVAGLAGTGGAAFALVEHAILASVIVLAAAVALSLRVSLAWAVPLVALFGTAHGWAHGVEGSGGLDYAAGFLIATAALHTLGVALGRLGPVALRLAGGAVALGGVALAVT